VAVLRPRIISPEPLEGKVVFITGAASGIGRAQAIRFAREGASVVVADLTEDGVQAAFSTITPPHR
jgi:NAD(P)-dependent dehydrogenase (short-subunit alcohol dehydrogenase family)